MFFFIWQYNKSMFVTVFFFAIVGLIIGSFLNVVVYRLQDAETLLGRSFCRSCHHQIRWYDNVPLLSYLILRGKCRDCQAGISIQYPLLEAVTGLVFALVGLFFFRLDDSGTWLETVRLLGMASLFITIATYDLIYMEIPIKLLIASFLWIALFLVLSIFLQPEEMTALWRLDSFLSHSLLGGLVVGLFFFALVYASRETWMGWGDVWLGAIAGMMVGLPAVLFMLTLSFGLGAVVGLILMARGEKHIKSQIPFAPYLVAGTLLTLLLAHVFPYTMLWSFLS